MNAPILKASLPAVVVAVLCFGEHRTAAAPLVSVIDFNSSGGDFTVVNTNYPGVPWTWDGARGTWFASDRSGCTNAFRSSRLNGPILTVASAGTVTISFSHRYSFEADTTLWDGGQLRISVNQAPYVVVPAANFSANGYNYVVGGASVPNNELAGQLAFTTNSPGYETGTFITSVATLGTFNAGDTISIQFLAAWDDCSEGQVPNWEIDSVQFNPPLEDRRTAPTFTNPLLPADASVVQGRSHTLRAEVTGHVTLQWFKDSAAIPGATELSYTITNMASGDAGQYFLQAGNSIGTTDSRVATVTFVTDNTPPVLLFAYSDRVDLRRFVVIANEPLCVDPLCLGDALDSFTYGIESLDGLQTLTVNSATVVNGTNIVLISDSDRTLGQNYRIRVDMGEGVADIYGNIIPKDTPASQVIAREPLVFQEGVNGYAGTVDTHVRADNTGTAYGSLVAVLADNLTPLSHALIRFDNIFGTGASQIPYGATILSATLTLRTDNWGNPLNVHRMLVPWDETSTWNSVGSANNGVNLASGDAVATPEANFTAAASGSAVGEFRDIDLTASVQVWATNGAPNYGWAIIDTGDDGYQFNSSEATTVTYRPALKVNYVVFAKPITITQQPQSLALNERQSAVFTVVVDGSNPQFQWYHDNVLIPGATGPSYTIPGVVPADNGSYTVTISNDVPSGAVSAAATLSVTPDTLRPTVLTAQGGAETNTTIVVTFSESVTASTAQTASNYELLGPGGITIQSALLSDATVTLSLSGPRTPGQNYELRVKDITDTAVSPNTINPNPTTLPVSTLVDVISINTHAWKYLQQTVLDAPQPCLDETPWTLPGYDDSGWTTGNGVFFGNRTNSVAQPDPNPLALPLTLDGSSVLTILNVFTNGANALQETAYYFRTKFNYPSGSTNGGSLLLHSMVDDGAVFYLNGNRVYDLRITNNPASCTNFTAGGANGSQAWEPALTNRGQIIGLAGLVPGENTLAVQVHQVNTTSSDVNLGVLLQAEVLTLGVPAPRLSASYDSAGKILTLSWTAADYVLVESTSLSGPWNQVSATSPASVSTASGTKFYQLRKL